LIQLFRYFVLGYVQQWKQNLHLVFFEDNTNTGTSTEHDADDITAEELKELEEEAKQQEQQQQPTPQQEERRKKEEAKAQKRKRTTLFVNLLSKLASNWMYIISAICILVLWHAIFWPVFVTTKVKDEQGNMILNIYSPDRCGNIFVRMSIAFTILVILHGVAIFASLVVVWITQWRKCCNLRKILIEDDPFRFQLEALALLFFNAVYLIVVDVVTILLPVGPFLVAIITVVLYDIMNLVIMPGIPLVMTYYWDWRVAQRLKVQEQAKYSPCLETLVSICNSAQLYQMFKDFAMKEFSVENLLCWKEICKYQGLKNASERRKVRLAKRIYDLYLDPASVMEVNIVQSMRDEVKQALEEHQKNKGLALSMTLFDKISAAVSNNLLDTYSRFHKSQAFKQYIEKNG
jgi:hypothetical protein